MSHETRDSAAHSGAGGREIEHAALEHAAVGIAVLDREGRVVHVNPAGASLLGWPVEELLARELHATVHRCPDPARRGEGEPCALAAALRRGEERRLDHETFWRRDGASVSVEVVVAPFGAGDGPSGSVVTWHDITARRQAEEATRQRERQLAQAQKLAHVGGWEWDLATDHVSWSDELYEIYGLPRGGFAGTVEAFLGLLHPDDRDGTRAAVEEALATGRPFAYEERIVRPDGRVRVLHSQGEVIVDAEGRPVRLVGVCQDVTERREAARRQRQLVQEQAARAEAEAGQRRLRFLADSIPQHVWTATPDGRVDEVNRRMAEYFGAEASELVGDGWAARVHPADRERVIGAWRGALATGEPFEAEARLRAADGSFRWHLARAVPQRDGSGSVLKWFGTNTDIQDQKEAEAARDRALAELARSNRELDQFAYVASHDLRAPLRGIANLSQWLEEDLGDALTEETAQQLDLLRGRVTRMEALIDGLLQYSRAGRRREEPETVDLLELAREVVDLLSPPEGMRVELVGELPQLRSRRLPLQQVLLNLVGNAVKHHDRPEGRVEIGGRSAQAEGLWEIWVRDDGPGIPLEYQDRVWTIFQTLRPRDEVEGTGIGLAVVRKLVETHGGRIWLESAPGEGTTFRFLWPLEERDAS